MAIPLDQLIAETRRNKRAILSGMRADFERDGYVRLDLESYGWRMLIHRAVDGARFRVTRFDWNTWEPEGHAERATVEEVIAETYELAGGAKELKERYRGAA